MSTNPVPDPVEDEQTIYLAKREETRRKMLRDLTYRPDPVLTQLQEIPKQFLKFIFLPGTKNAVIEERSFRLNRFRSKRKFYMKMVNPLTLFGMFLALVIATWAIFSPWISLYHYDYVAVFMEDVDGIPVAGWLTPRPGFPFGTVKFGRDIFSRLIWGARTSITLGLTSIVIASVFGVLLGIFSAYTGGWIDSLIMRLIDIIMAFPGLIIVILVVSIFGRDMTKILLVYGLLGIPGYARLIRGNVLQEKNKTYVEAAKVAGASNVKIMLRHILPNAIAPVIVAVSFSIGGVILSLAGLSFLGFGDQRLVEWGFDISDAQQMIYVTPLAIFVPGIGIFIAVLSFMLIGDGLRDALDPRLQGRK